MHGIVVSTLPIPCHAALAHGPVKQFTRKGFSPLVFVRLPTVGRYFIPKADT